MTTFIEPEVLLTYALKKDREGDGLLWEDIDRYAQNVIEELLKLPHMTTVLIPRGINDLSRAVTEYKNSHQFLMFQNKIYKGTNYNPDYFDFRISSEVRIALEKASIK